MTSYPTPAVSVTTIYNKDTNCESMKRHHYSFQPVTLSPKTSHRSFNGSINLNFIYHNCLSIFQVIFSFKPGYFGHMFTKKQPHFSAIHL